MFENQWRSTERLLPKSKSCDGEKIRFSASTGDIRKHYCSTSKDANDSFDYAHPHDVDALRRYLGHPGYPTRHNSARSNEGRSPIQKSHTETDIFYNLESTINRNSVDLGFVKHGYNNNSRDDPACADDERDKRHTSHHPKPAPKDEGEYGDLRDYNIDALRKEARRLKQSLSEEQVNTHFIDESNFDKLCSMIQLLTIEKRRRLLDFVLQQEEFVKCNWDREAEKYKALVESKNRRDSGFGNRSSSEPKSDLDDEVIPPAQHARLPRGTGLLSMSSSGYFEQDKFADEKRTAKTFLYRRQVSDECRSDKSGKSNLSAGRPQSVADCDGNSQPEFVNYRSFNAESHAIYCSGNALSVASDGASGKI